MARLTLILFLLLPLLGCESRNEANLPPQGTLVERRSEPGERYQVTWSGVSTYNEGACEVRQPCVHLVRTNNSDNRVEVAVTLADFSQQFRRTN